MQKYWTLRKKPNEARLCNCRNKQSCTLDGKCLSSSIVYRAEVISDNNTKIYYGASEGEFKTRYNNNTKSFRHKKYCSETELSRHICSLNSINTSFPLIYGPHASRLGHKSTGKKRGSVTYSTDRENEVSKIFIISLRLTGARARKLVKVKRKVQLPQRMPCQNPKN